MRMLPRIINISTAIVARQFLSLLLTSFSLSLPIAFLPILVAPPQVLAQTIEERKAEADRLLRQGFEQYQTSQFQSAIQPLQQALEIYEDIGARASKGVTLTVIGEIYRNLGQYLQALEYFQQALSITQEVGDRASEGVILNNIGAVYANQGQYLQALEYFQQALSITQEVGDRASEGLVLSSIGEVYRNLGRYSQALGYLQQALSITQEVGDRASEGVILNNIGSVYNAVGQYLQALDYFQQALIIRQEVGDREEEGASLNSIGLVYADLGQYSRALEYLQWSLSIRQEVGDRVGEGITLNSIGSVYANLGQYSRALEHFQQTLFIAREVSNQALEGTILNNIGTAYINLGQYPQALDSYQQALFIIQEIGDRTSEGAILNNIGTAYINLGQYPQALDSYQQALFIIQEIDDRTGEGQSLAGIGSVYADLGQYSRALEYLQWSLSIRQEVGDREEEGASLNSIGLVYADLGQYSRALEYLQWSLSIRQEVGDRVGEGITLNSIGSVYANLGQYSRALEHFQQTLFIAREVSNQALEGTILNNIGTISANLEQYSQALDAHQQALSIAGEVGNREGEGATLNNIGNVYRSLGQYPQALEYYQQALSIVQEVGNRVGEGKTLSNIGVVLFESGQLQSAETALSNALIILEELRQQDLSDTDKISLFDTQFNVYQLLQQVQIAQNQIELALETSERGRGRAFVSLLSQGLQQEADSIPNLLTPSISNIQQTAREQNVTLVQYSVIYTAVETPAIYIWVISPTGEIAFRSVELNEENQQVLSGAIDTVFNGNAVFRGESTTISNLVSDILPSRSATRDVQFEYNPGLATDRLQQLHQLLIEPIADLLPTNSSDRVVFIPQGGLFLVPFAALQDENGDHLIEHHTISIAPSIQILDLTRQQANPNRSLDNALVVGNPDMPTIWDAQSNANIPLSPLPRAEQEAKAIAQFLNTNAITGNAATETVITQQMPDASIIHLATHGLLEYGIPSDSGVLDVPGAIALTRSNQDDGLLTSAEILEMQLQAELVVLSACDTGRGRITGDGVVGLSRAFISAGVPSVVVSLWSVPDAPTADLMTEFYRQLETQPDKAQALRQAMLITMQQHPDPIDWAAFTLIGEAQ